MAGFNLADRYRTAGLNPGPEVLGLRKAPFDTLRAAVDVKSAIELSRLYFGLSSPNGTDWFRDAFRQSDTSFSMVDNQRETAILAASLLEAALEDGKVTAALVPLATSVAGLRSPATNPELLAELDRALSAKAVSARQRDHSDSNVIKLPATGKMPTDAAAFAQAITNQWDKIAGYFKQVSDESYEATKNLANQTATVVKPMHADVADLREEVGMLWWHIGGWSRLLDVPFSELPAATAGAMAGLDLSDLCRTLLGPAAAPAILHRTISVGRKGKIGKATIREAVDGLSGDALDKLDLGPALLSIPDICPVLTAFAKAREIGHGTSWHAAYRKSSGLTEDAELQTLDLAIQVYRERMILRALK